ncbi:MAG: hypothetical protein RBS57_01660, partial [Desulforhabdus sp.]|jgi:NADH-quinone oxidoreductase subunit L|nr:hypothetical protein [Desulforhabdus sp.]
MVCMTVGALALSGVFPFSGFFSKEAIMGVLASHPNKLWLLAGLLGALMTAYYSFRLIFMILFPKKIDTTLPHDEVHHHKEKDAVIEIDHEHGAAGHGSSHGHGGGHDHEAGHGNVFWYMAWPLIILTTITLFLGFFQSSLEGFLVGHGAEGHGEEGGHGAGHYILLITAVSMALAGIFWAYMEFGRKGASQDGFLSRLPKMEALFANRWYIDRFLRRFLDRAIYGGLTNIFTRNDRRIIDGGIDGFCLFTIGSGRILSFLQSSMLQYNLLVMIAAVGLVVLYFMF